MALTLSLSREKYRRFFFLAGGGNKTSRLLFYSHGGGDKPLRLPLSSVRGGDCADFSGIGSRVLIDQIWFGGPVDSEDGSDLDPSIVGGDNDRRSGQIDVIGGGDAWRRSNDGSVVFDGGGDMSRADLYLMRYFGSKVAVTTVGGFERKAAFPPFSGGGADFWLGSVPLGDEGSDMLMVKDGDLAHFAFVDNAGSWGGIRPGRGGLAVAMWWSFAAARQVGGGGGVPLTLLRVTFIIALWVAALWADAYC